MVKNKLFALVLMACSSVAFATDVNFIFAFQGKEIGVDQSGDLVCTAGCAESDDGVRFQGDAMDFTFEVWYVAGPTVIGRTDGGVACPAGGWYAIDTYSLVVKKLPLSCEDISDRVFTSTDHRIEFKVTQGGRQSTYVFQD